MTTNEVVEIWPYGNYALDASTGLPVLPEGHFWRIRRSLHPYAYIEVREKRRFGSRKITEIIAMQDELENRSVVLRKCAQALTQHRERIERARPKFTGYGDYPPKKYAGEETP